MEAKKEGIARALTEIDDRFLEEAASPRANKIIRFPTPARQLAAACLLLMVLCVPVFRYYAAGVLKVNVSGQNVLTASVQYTAPAVAAFSVRSAPVGFPVPLELKPGQQTVTLTAGSGSTLLREGTGEAVITHTVTGFQQVTWLLDISGGSRFQLTVESGGRTYLVSAEYDDAAGSVTITTVKK